MKMTGKVRGGILALIFGAVLALVPFRTLHIVGHSMEPTLHDGETYLLDTFYWRGSGLHYEDIIVVNHMGERWVKRLVGMPGDDLQVECRADGYVLNVINTRRTPQLARQEALPGTYLEMRHLGPDELFVLGDNVNRSADSTQPAAGKFELGDIIGVVRTFTGRRHFPFRKHL